MEPPRQRVLLTEGIRAAWAASGGVEGCGMCALVCICVCLFSVLAV